ncbi:VOC family protein [Paenibacillus mendelii]|uniref:VOC family protein n=1 Tax=Paenibacillus mendelii TaxID=206163 RepID=A0ABV6J4A9_9BACL|nr:VOC family protein [Paenibacillus mendelii]MCQ6559418.1 VOC family protein [Paenibacillus mendelii]
MSRVKFSVKVLVVSDMEASKRFYADVLGCEVTDWWVVRDDYALGFKLIQADRIEDVQPNKVGKYQEVSWDTYAYVETHADMDELYEAFKAKGARFIQEPVVTEADWGAWKEFVIVDPDNYAIGFGSGKKN